MSARTRRGRWLPVVLLVGLWALPSGAAAQVAGVLRGEVRDSAGEAVAGAQVTLRDLDGATVAGTQTDRSGRYILVGLEPGEAYTLTVEALGFATVTRSNVKLVAGQTRRLDVILGSRPVEVEGIRVVTAPDLIFSGTRTGAVTVIEDRAVASLPTIERDINDFAALSPLVSVDGDAISVAGQNTRYNSLRIDGVVSQDVFGLSPSGVPGGQAGAKPLPLDAVRQYTVLVAPYDVRQSGFTGGLLNAVTNSGGERWSGEGFGYYRGGEFSGALPAGALESGIQGPAQVSTGEIIGFNVGGPIGDARLFVAAEYEEQRRPVPGFHLNAEPQQTRLVADNVAAIQSVLDSQYGIDPGSADRYRLGNPLGNAFARLDLPVGERHDLTVHYNWISAEKDLPPNRLPVDAYELSSGAVRLKSQTHSAMGRVASRLGPHTTNELLLNVQRTEDANRATSPAPQVEVDVTSAVDDLRFVRRLQAGGDPRAHANALDQTMVHLANNVGHAVGDHLFTTGVGASWYGVRRRFLPASRGIWRFDSVEALRANAPSSYERLVLREDADPDVEFSALQLSSYVQDEWSITDGLSLTLGVRLDLPLTLTRPGYNREAELIAGVVTDRLPPGRPLFSPRVGFNWSPATERPLQIRGGIGVFTGAPPLAWLADAYADTGLRTAFLVCENEAAPALDPESRPTECEFGQGPRRPNLTFFDEDFRYPQDVRASLAVDRELPFGFVATVEAVLTRALHQVTLEDLNLLPADSPFASPDYPVTIGSRPIFGAPLLVPERFGPVEPGRRWSELGSVIRVGNRSRNAALATVAELKRRFGDRLDLSVGYTYSKGVDVRSLRHESAALNYGLTPIRWDPARPEARLSEYIRPHRVVGSLWGRLAEWGEGLDLSIVYVGQSGLPYSYVYASDVNGDGFPGPGAFEDAYNDLLFVPATTSSSAAAGLASDMLLFQLARLDPCLEEYRGRILARNECRTPWTNRVDLRISQGVPIGGGGIRVTADIMNLLNLLDPDWGLVQIAPSRVPILTLDQRLGCPGLGGCAITNPVVGEYLGPRTYDPETGKTQAVLPYTTVLPESVWRAQLGVQVSF